MAMRDEWIGELDRRDADLDYPRSLSMRHADYYSPAQLEQQAGAYERELAEYMAVYPPRRS
jgi:hypothetical protein